MHPAGRGRQRREAFTLVSSRGAVTGRGYCLQGMNLPGIRQQG